MTKVAGPLPRADRPRGGYWDTSRRPGLTWAWAERRLARARNYWVTTTRRDGRPYSRPVWGLWVDGTFVFDSMSIDPNLKRNPRVEVHLESGEDVVIVEGVAERVSNQVLLRRFMAVYSPKYDWDWGDGGEAPQWVWRVRPRVAYGWVLDRFGPSATRWTFAAPRRRKPPTRGTRRA